MTLNYARQSDLSAAGPVAACGAANTESFLKILSAQLVAVEVLLAAPETVSPTAQWATEACS